MWIVHRVVKDDRSSTGSRLQSIGWIKAETDEEAKDKARKVFGTSLKLVRVSDKERDWGWL